MLNTLRFSLRTPTVFQQFGFHDCLFLIALASLSLSNYIGGLGFYSDDWGLFYSMKLSPDQSFAGVFTAVNSTQDNEIRPIQFLAFTVSYKLFGLNPLGYHLLNALFLVTGCVLLYLILITLHQPRVLALSTPILYITSPNYSTDRFWIAAHASNISMFFTFLGIYAHLQALRRQKSGYWGWEAFAILCVIASGLAYEVFFPLVLVTTVFLFASELAKDWPLAIGGRTVAKAILRQSGIVMAVVLLLIVKALWAPRAARLSTVDVISYFIWVSKCVAKAFIYSYGYHVLELPSTAWHGLRDYSHPMMVLTAAVVGILIFVKLYTSWDQASTAAMMSRRKMLMYLGCGIVLFVAGYSLVPLIPVKNGISNRTAIAGTLGVAASIVGFLGMLTAFTSGIWQKVLFSAAAGFIGMSGALTIEVLANFWIGSYRLQNEYLSDIHRHIPTIPAGTILLIDGLCPYNGPAPVFEEPWDLSSALSVLYGHEGIEANVITRWLRVEPNGLITPFCCGEHRYPFDRLFVYHFGRKISYPLPDAQTARSYFTKISPDRASRCPDDFFGNGVDVLGGFIPMLGRNPYAPKP